jgi:hypothetical protein
VVLHEHLTIVVLLQEYFGGELAAKYATARAFALTQGAKYFAVARSGPAGEAGVQESEQSVAGAHDMLHCATDAQPVNAVDA